MRAKAFAEKPCGARVVLACDDSPGSMRFKGFTERLARHRLYRNITTKWIYVVQMISRRLGEREFKV